MRYETYSPQSEPSAAAPVRQPLETLTGVLERLTFHNEENGYTVARVAVEGARDLVTVVGNFSNPIVGESLFCEGRWVSHREFGRQFQVERYSTTQPATAFAIKKYLGSGLIKGIGPVMAERMVDLFGTDTLDIIEKEPRKLLRVQGIGEKRVEMIQKAWDEQREIRNVMLFLQGHGVSATFAVKIYKTYGDKSIATVEENPYRLAQDIRGIGFKTADKIAQQLGFAVDSERRLEAGLLYTLSEATDFGHLYLPEPKLLQSAAEILGVEPAQLAPVLETMAAAQAVIAEEIPGIEMAGRPMRAFYHPALYYTEIGLAAQLRRRLLLPPSKPLSREKIAAWLEKQEQAQGVTLSQEQREAVALALESRILVLTGGPGTGKTTVTNLIARAFDAQKKRLLLVSPTGRAAKRLSEVTGREAQTIHRLLKFDPATHSFQFNDTNPLPCDVLIADEV
ncbi:MAG TPA: helix-hairpin-helix domain-containing protein, partial [Chthonomonadaceae bacterium]|nr:helix-hairpin-helix domain-containing protein [Chthonomonadaceae bacterium]